MVTEVTEEKNQFQEAFLTLQRKAAPTWLVQLRENAFEYFKENGLPTVEEEDWKYTNLAPLAKTDFDIQISLSDNAGHVTKTGNITNQAIKAFIVEESAKSQLVFINGIYSEELSSVDMLPTGTVATNLSKAFDGEYKDIVRKYLGSMASYDKSPLVALNTAFVNNGAFIYIPKEVQVSSPIHLIFINNQNESKLVTFPRILIVAENHSSATVIENYFSLDNGTYWTNAVIESFVGEGARLVHYKLQRESEEAFHIAETRAELDRSGIYNTTTITLGAQLSRHNIGIQLDHEGSECSVDGLYLVGNNQHTDTHSLIDHISPHCKSHQLYKGILDGKARAVFNGKVFVHRNAQQTDAFQTNKNLLLSKDARVDTKPQLEIFADDVKCAHGATVGQLEDEELFYLTSRGLNPSIARNLLTYGFAEEIVEKINIDSIKNQLNEIILNRLHTEL